MDNKPPASVQADENTPRNPLDRAIVRIGDLLSLLFIVTALISFYEVVMRYAFNAPTTWVHETASFIGGALFIFGGIYAFATNKHVRVVLIYDAVSAKKRRYLNIFHHIVGLVFAGMLAYSAYFTAEESWFAPWGDLRLETSGSVLNAPYPALLKGLLFAVLCVLVIQFTLHLLQEISSIRKSKDV
ncbi:TRAP transporter small permease subunit [Enterovibrio sp. ZSDZ42]|uniref:TRAP transporter small permease protein n=1 Tax=Enterovibrio gelatinilyticus TaxID=2899819 RepID=A0ABT5R118_9GAMM|nr:TRAP transporter small permease subunit [Enterovibrio sp. ZSDZ42]MDD1793959.1 TRAP transporter small permease subunit [Enterovibrio sp. ZSDZ42]